MTDVSLRSPLADSDPPPVRAAVESSDDHIFYRKLIETLPAAVYTCNLRGEITLYNHAAVDLWARAPAKGELDAPLTKTDAPMARVLAGGPPVRNEEVVIERPNGTRITASVNIDSIRNAAGKIIGAVNVFYDVTARKDAETQLKVAKALAEEASKAKDRFLAVLSHELRTPLTPVLMSASALESNADLPPDVREDIGMIRRNVELETKLIDDLLDLNRVASNKLRLQPRLVDLNDITRRVCSICRQQVQEKGLHLHCDLDDQLLSVMGDPARLQQVLWNILKNAAKFTPEGGDIYVSTHNDGDRVRVTVRDTGPGIAPDLLPRIFNAFEQGSANVTQQFGGLGLGLAISKALVDLHGGTIRVDSDGPGKGAVFTIGLPAKRQPAQTDGGRVMAPPPAPPANLRILLVEDHADTARLLGRILRGSGYLVRTATTAAKALELLDEEPADLLISDIGLPDATGHALFRDARQRYPVKGIAMSGFGMDDDVRKSHAAGFAEHLTKPVSIDQLQDAIRRVAESPVS